MARELIKTAVPNEAIRNYLMNGRLDFWQRGTSVSLNLTTVTANTILIADRFRSYSNRVTNNQNYTWSRQTDVPTFAQAGVSLPYSIRCTSNLAHSFTGEDRIDALYQLLEGTFLSDLGASDKIYINFWFKSNIAIPTACFRVGINPTGAAITNTYVGSFSYTTANTWQKVSVAIDLPGVEFYRGSNGWGICLNMLGVTGSSSAYQTNTLNTWLNVDKHTTPTATNWAATLGNWVQFAGLSMTKQQVANVPLAGKNYAEELALCQRYYEKSHDIDTQPGLTNSVVGEMITLANSSGAVRTAVRFKVSKRSTPVFTVYSPTTGLAGYGRDAGGIDRAAAPELTSDGENGVSVIANGAQVSATFTFNWTADAEL